MNRTVLVSNFGRIAHEVERRIEPVVAATAEAVRSDAVQSMSGPKSGRAYKIGNVTRAGGSRNTKILGKIGLKRVSGEDGARFIVGSRIHRASAPGEPPARRSGRLAGSGRLRRDGKLKQAVEFATEYAAAMELGSPDGKTAPRPFVRPALERQTQDFERAVGQAVSDGIADGEVA